jgi:hypothetical protein
MHLLHSYPLIVMSGNRMMMDGQERNARMA